MRATKANWRSACLQVLYRIRRRACAISSVCGDKGGLAGTRHPQGASNAWPEPICRCMAAKQVS